jgi:alpha-tubulin suppressor-like RCC1 family protein
MIMRRARRVVLGLVPTALIIGLGVQSAQAQTDSVYRWGGYQTVSWGSTGNQGVPTLVPGLSGVVALAAGNSATYALMANGQEWVWGDNGFGQLGNKTRAQSLFSPVQVQFPAGTDITAIGEADDMAFAVDSHGHGWSWGWNGGGALCLGNHRGRDGPTRVPGLSKLVAVKGGGGEVVWLTAQGTVYTCGRVLTGDHNSPTLVTGLPAGDPVVAISAGNAYATALLASGEIWDWGVGGSGQLGNGSFHNSALPVRAVLPSGTYATQVYSGGDLDNDGHQLALLNTGAVVSWGSNVCRQLGTDEAPPVAVPVPVQVLSGITVKSVAAGGSTSFVIDSNGNLWAWGSNKGGQVREPTGKCVRTPTRVDTGVDMVSATASDVVDHHG